MKSLKLKTQDGKDQEFSVQKLIAATKPTKLAYKILIRKNSTSPKKGQEKWIKDCGLELEVDLFTAKVVYDQYKYKELPVQISPQTYSREYLSI